MAVRQYYTRSMPKSPQQEVGRTFAMKVNYGQTVYVTANEERNMNFIYLVAALATTSTFGFAIIRVLKIVK